MFNSIRYRFDVLVRTVSIFAILNRPTTNEHQVASRRRKAIDSLNNNALDDPLVRMRLNHVSKLKFDRNLITRYKHDARLASYKQNIHQLWNQIFAETSVMNIKLIVGSQNNQKTTKILVRHRPHHISSRKTANNVYNI